jgi:hypothetical protein
MARPCEMHRRQVSAGRVGPPFTSRPRASHGKRQFMFSTAGRPASLRRRFLPFLVFQMSEHKRFGETRLPDSRGGRRWQARDRQRQLTPKEFLLFRDARISCGALAVWTNLINGAPIGTPGGDVPPGGATAVPEPSTWRNREQPHDRHR